MAHRIREGLLHDNKVVPSVLAVLAFLVFAWLIGGVLVGDRGEEGEQRAANQASLGQGGREENPDRGGGLETPAPEAENRDADSYAAFKPKDPFRDLIPPKATKSDNGKGGDSKANSQANQGDKGKSGDSKAQSKAGESGNGKGSESKAQSKAGTGTAKGKTGEGAGSTDQPLPKDSSSGGGSNREGNPGRGSNLFDSGGDLAP